MSSISIAHIEYPSPVIVTSSPILVTGAAGFIGFHTSKALLDLGHTVVGVDNLNEYYSVDLKKARLLELSHYPNFTLIKEDIADFKAMQSLFQQNDFQYIIHLAAQAGVRYSLTHPMPYIQTNIVGFMNILECARHLKNLKNMAYASSSSVYGENKKQPFSEDDRVDNPMSLYAATKRADELIAQSYHHLYQIPLTGLRFFTVYGPWGRPDMAAYSFTRSIFEKKPIDVYNYGKMERDYTYVADTVIGILRSLTRTIDVSKQNHEIYNLGNNATEPLDRFISILEHNCGTKAIQNLLPIQPGDVPSTCACIAKAQEDFKYHPKIRIDEGLKYFVAWYKNYHNKT